MGNIIYPGKQAPKKYKLLSDRTARSFAKKIKPPEEMNPKLRGFKSRVHLIRLSDLILKNIFLKYKLKNIQFFQGRN